MFLAQEKLRFISSITHEGKVVVVSTDDEGRLLYTIRQDGFEDSYGNTQARGWEDWQVLDLPDEEPDTSVVAHEAQTLTYASAGETHYLVRSLYRTHDQSAMAPVQLVSGMGHLYVCRQSKVNTLLVDRFVLDGLSNKLVRKLDVRYKRSRKKYEPIQQNDSPQLAAADSLDFRDADGQPFYAPTTELSVINNLQNGWFVVVLVPTNEHDKYRWHIFAYNSATRQIELTTLRASEQGLFDLQDYTVLEPDTDDPAVHVPRSIPGIIKRAIVLDGLTVTNGLAATKYDVQTEREMQAGRHLLREATRIMLTIPTAQGTAALSFAVAQDGTLAQIDAEPHTTILRSDARDVLLPLNTLDEIQAIGARELPPQGQITRMERAADDRVKLTYTATPEIQLRPGTVVQITDTAHYNGHYVIQKVDADTFEIAAPWITGEMGTWEVLPREERGLIFDGIITAFAYTADGTIRVTAPNHGLETNDEVQIIDTQPYDGTYPVLRHDTDHFTIDLPWRAGEAVNVEMKSRKRRGITFDDSTAYIAVAGPVPTRAATHEFWFKTSDPTCGLFSVTDSAGNADRAMVLRDGNIIARLDTETISSTDLNLADGQWHHVAHAFGEDIGGQHLCIDGREVARGTVSRSAAQPNSLRIGVAPDLDNPAQQCQIADVRLWQVARSVETIKNSMHLQLTGREVDLVGYWRLGAIREGEARTVVDFSVAGRDGIVHGNAFANAVRLDRTLRDGQTSAIAYQNDEGFAVTQRATYVESFEFTTEPAVDPQNVDGRGTPIFALDYWGTRSRGATQRIPFAGTPLVFEALGNGWYRVTSRFTVRDDIALVRSFALADVAGDWQALHIRKHAIRLVSDTTTESRFVDQVSLTTLADRHAEFIEHPQRIAQQEAEEARLLRERHKIEAELTTLRDTGTLNAELVRLQSEIAGANQNVTNLRNRLPGLQRTYQNERNNIFNYWCSIRSLTSKRRSEAARVFTHGGENRAEKKFIHGLDWGNHSNQRFKFEERGGGYYAIICEYENRILDGSDKVVWGVRDHGRTAGRAWKFSGVAGTNTYTIQSQNGNYLALDDNHHIDILNVGYKNKTNRHWQLTSTGAASNTKIADAQRNMQNTQQQLTRAEQHHTELVERYRKLERDARDRAASIRTLEQQLRDVTARLQAVQQELARLVSEFLTHVRTVQQTPQAMPLLATDARGLGVRGAVLSFVRPQGRLNALETSEGNVQLSYIDTQGRMRLTNFDATADSQNSTFEQWLPDALRACARLDQDASVIQLNTPIILGDDWTIEAWFVTPLPAGRREHTLIAGDDLRIVVREGQHLGVVAGSFHDSTYRLDTLSDGWHHLAVVGRTAEDGTIVTFFIDGKPVGTPIAASARGSISHIGNRKEGQQPFGKLAEVRIWDTALNEAEIAINSKTLLGGNEPELVAYYPLNEADGNTIRTHTGDAEYHGTLHAAQWWAFGGQIGMPDTAPPANDAALVSAEYSTISQDAAGRKVALMRRFLAYPVPGGVHLLPEKRIEELELRWIGNAQFAPTLLGYIEGAPPVPSENLTVNEDYNGATSVELIRSEDVTYSWNREQVGGLGVDTSIFLGANFELTAGLVVEKKLLDAKVGFQGQFSSSYSFLNTSSVAASAGAHIADKLELRGTPEREPAFPHLGRRFVPKNVGYALVVSGLADVYITLLKRSGRMVSYQVVPNEDVPPDVNTITFLINPAYLMVGSLDGLTGSQPTSERFFRHVPEMRAQYGAAYPASYYRIAEANDLQRQIEQQDRDRESYFTNFNSRLVDEASLGRAIGSPDPAGSTPRPNRIEDQADADQPETDAEREARERAAAEEARRNADARGEELSEAGEAKRAEIEAKIADQEARVHALESWAGWQRKMEQLQIRAGKRNIVNTYVWDADGGLRTESQQFASTVEHTIGGSFSMQGGLGLLSENAGGGVGFDLTAMATFHLTQTLTKTESRSKGFELYINLSGVESMGVTDHHDAPMLPGEKVDRYRLKSFYLEGNTSHFQDFFRYVVDPEWLASNAEEARALRQIDTSRPNKIWRVLHRVTAVERPALMGFGQDTRRLAERREPAQTRLLERFERLEQANKELQQRLDQILEELKVARVGEI
ncbi:MAG: LamG-like jellyroll fold domain-containing protein [Chloroflexaceae bacterium]